jgi:hypothetical protein
MIAKLAGVVPKVTLSNPSGSVSPVLGKTESFAPMLLHRKPLPSSHHQALARTAAAARVQKLFGKTKHLCTVKFRVKRL